MGTFSYNVRQSVSNFSLHQLICHDVGNAVSSDINKNTVCRMQCCIFAATNIFYSYIVQSLLFNMLQISGNSVKFSLI